MTSVANVLQDSAVGKYLALVRARAGVSQADLARSMTVSPAVLSRIESGERSAAPEEIDAYLDALGNPDANALREYLRQEWRELSKPQFDHPERGLLWQAEQALREIRALYDRPDLRHAFQKHVEAYEEEVRRLATILASRNAIVAAIGSIGVGKSTMLCRLTGLEVQLDGKDQTSPVLETGGGGTTICEVHIKQGPEYGLLVEPRTDSEIRADVGDFCEYARMTAMPTASQRAELEEEGETLGIGKEVVRAIRNMAKLNLRKEKDTKGRTKTSDPAKELARECRDTNDLIVQVLSRMELPRRDRRDIWYSKESGKSPLPWLQETFEAVNNGRHSDFSLPRRIEVVVPSSVIQSAHLDVRIVDTKGIDQAAERADIECHFDDPHTIVVLCSRFNDAPEAAVQTLLTRAKQAGVRDISTRASIVVLPRPEESVAMKFDDGARVTDDDEGYDLKRDQVEMRLQHLGLGDVPAAFFNARRDEPATLQKFILERVDALREVHKAKLGDVIRAVHDSVRNYENEQAQAVLRQAASRLRVWLKSNRDLAADAWAVHDDLLFAMRGAYASTVRASVRREGEWPNLDYFHHLGFGARKIASSVMSRRLDAFRAVADNLLADDQFREAHDFIRQMQAILENAVEDVLKKIQIVGREAFAADLKTDQNLWQECVSEWGRGSGYKVRVTGHNERWFSADQKKARHEFVSDMIVKEWVRIMETLAPLLDVGAERAETASTVAS